MSCSQDSLCLLLANGLLLAATPCLCYSCQGSLVQESYYNLLLLKQPITHYRVTIYWPNLMCPILVTLVRLFLVPCRLLLNPCVLILVTLVRLFLVPCRLLLNPCVLSLVSGLSVLPLPGPDPQAYIMHIPTHIRHKTLSIQRPFLLNSQPFKLMFKWCPISD
jgi:hypothetical protein